MPKLTFDEKEIIKRVTISRDLLKDEAEKGRLAVKVPFFQDPPFDPAREVIEVIRRKK
jgi:hypothetical protein